MEGKSNWHGTVKRNTGEGAHIQNGKDNQWTRNWIVSTLNWWAAQHPSSEQIVADQKVPATSMDWCFSSRFRDPNLPRMLRVLPLYILSMTTKLIARSNKLALPTSSVPCMNWTSIIPVVHIISHGSWVSPIEGIMDCRSGVTHLLTGLSGFREFPAENYYLINCKFYIISHYI